MLSLPSNGLVWNASNRTTLMGTLVWVRIAEMLEDWTEPPAPTNPKKVQLFGQWQNFRRWCGESNWQGSGHTWARSPGPLWGAGFSHLWTWERGFSGETMGRNPKRGPNGSNPLGTQPPYTEGHTKFRARGRAFLNEPIEGSSPGRPQNAAAGYENIGDPHSQSSARKL